MTDAEKLDQLETWATLAADRLQEICNDAQEAAGNPTGTDQCADLRVLIDDLNRIMVPDWQLRLAGQAGDMAQLGDL